MIASHEGDVFRACPISENSSLPKKEPRGARIRTHAPTHAYTRIPNAPSLPSSLSVDREEKNRHVVAPTLLPKRENSHFSSFIPSLSLRRRSPSRTTRGAWASSRLFISGVSFFHLLRFFDKATNISTLMNVCLRVQEFKNLYHRYVINWILYTDKV